MLIGLRNGMAASKKKSPYWGLCFTAEQENSTVSMIKINSSAPALNLEYSTDAKNWETFVVGTTTVTLADVGDRVWLRAGAGGNAKICVQGGYNRTTTTGKVAASGSVMSLLDGDVWLETIQNTFCFAQFFYNCTSLTQPPELPATTLAANAYDQMFQGCTSLIKAPALPATYIPYACYGQMFRGCNALTDVPDIPALSVEGRGLGQMFQDCTSLVKPPAIDVVEFVTGDYHMTETFRGCTSLSAAPALKATTLATRCYYQMFYNCKKLQSMDVSFTAWSPSNATYNWMYSAGSQTSGTKTFTCPTALGTDSTITRGSSNCPNGWTVVNK